jgi:RNA polymerase sigma factor (sigma-70 family)
MDRYPNETARKIAEKALSHVTGDLEAGRSDALLNYLTAMSRFRGYSWKNVLLIAAQQPNATQVAGIHTWNDFGRSIKKGEKGLLIFAPAEMKSEAARGQSPLKDDPFPRAGFRAAYVFDVSQTEGKPLPKSTPAKLDVWKYGEQLRALVAKRGIDLQVDRSIEPARGISDGGKIRLQPGLSPIQYLSTLAHELAHEMLHRGPGAAALSRDAIEAQAYGVAYVVARGLGIETRTDTAEYLAGYCRDQKAVAQTLAAIQETSAQILHELLPEERTMAGGFVSGSAQQNRVALDTEIFARLHRDYRDRVVESIAGFVRDREKAEDIAAGAFEVGWEKRGAFRGDASLHTWIQAIARNDAWQSHRRERSVQFESMDREDARELAAPDLVTDELEKQDERYRLHQALNQLPVKQRRALVAHFVDELSIRDIARQERVPDGTVLSRIHTGKQLLREAWETTLSHADVNGRELSLRNPEKARQALEPVGGTRPKSEPPEPASWDR